MPFYFSICHKIITCLQLLPAVHLLRHIKLTSEKHSSLSEPTKLMEPSNGFRAVNFSLRHCHSVLTWSCCILSRHFSDRRPEQMPVTNERTACVDDTYVVHPSHPFLPRSGHSFQQVIYLLPKGRESWGGAKTGVVNLQGSHI